MNADITVYLNKRKFAVLYWNKNGEKNHNFVHSGFVKTCDELVKRLEETPSPQEDSVLSEELAVFNNDQMNYYKDLDDLNKKVSTGDSSGDCYDNKGLIEKIME